MVEMSGNESRLMHEAGAGVALAAARINKVLGVVAPKFLAEGGDEDEDDCGEDEGEDEDEDEVGVTGSQ